MLSVLNMHPTHVVISSNKVHTERTFRTAATDRSGGARVALWRLASSERSRGQRLGWRVTIMFSSNPHLQCTILHTRTPFTFQQQQQHCSSSSSSNLP